jgi:hypothetical protein
MYIKQRQNNRSQIFFFPRGVIYLLDLNNESDFCVLAWNDKKNYLKASHVFCGLMLKKSLGLGGGLRKT